ncbi:VOC family protein, partial [Staphylococcus epidermidis]
MATLNFDHLIHYVDHLNQFHYPGQLLKLEPGGKHHRYGTFN